jgi:hypothetical protein
MLCAATFLTHLVGALLILDTTDIRYNRQTLGTIHFSVLLDNLVI